EKSTMFKRLKEFIQNNTTKHGILDSESNIKLIFSLVEFIVILFNIVILPLRFSFGDILKSNYLQIFDSFTMSNILLQIYIKLNTSYFSKGEIVNIRYQIFKKYLKTTMIFDIIILVFYLVSIFSYNLNYLSIIYLLKICKFYEIYSFIENKFQLRDQLSTLSDSLQLIFLVFFVAHLSGCAFYKIGILEMQKGNISYLTDIHAQNDPWQEIYVTSIYWSIVTMTTLGYGDIIPKNTKNKEEYNIAQQLVDNLTTTLKTSLKEDVYGKILTSQKLLDWNYQNTYVF
ncbi:k+-channel protein, putative, partial [Ichthyophthirius multifiliis]